MTAGAGRRNADDGVYLTATGQAREGIEGGRGRREEVFTNPSTLQLHRGNRSSTGRAAVFPTYALALGPFAR